MASELTVRFEPEAQVELEAATLWSARRGERALSRFVSAIEHAIQLIQAFPEAWPKTERGDARQITVLGTPYLLIYRLEPPEIVILAVAHGKQRPGYWQDRVPE